MKADKATSRVSINGVVGRRQFGIQVTGVGRKRKVRKRGARNWVALRVRRGVLVWCG